MGSHRRHNVKEIKFASNLLFCVWVLEGGLITFDFDERMLEGCFNIVGCSDFSEGLRVFWNTKHNCISLVKLYIYG